METEHLQKLETLISAFSIDEGNIFFGDELIIPSQQQANKEQLHNNLAGFIYFNCYCRNGESAPSQPEMKLSSTVDEVFIQQLQTANTSSGKPSEKWQVVMQMPNGDPVISKGTDTFSISQNDIINAETGNNQGSNHVTIRNPKEMMSNENSFYYVFSDNPEHKRNGALLRFYWNIGANGVPLLVYKLTSSLNQLFIPFQFKCLKHPALYSRQDAGVLYIFPRHLPVVYEILRQAGTEIKDFLKPGVPMFTLKLADGWSFAESPAGGQSFGMQHAGILSGALLEAFEKQLHERPKIDHVISIYRSLGFDLTFPYKNPGSVNNYNFLTQYAS